MKSMIPYSRWLLVLSPLLLFSCASGGSSSECTFSTDCPPGQRCRDNRCVVELGDGSVCPPGQVVQDGQCVIDESRCRINEDCPDGRCVDGECFANMCSDGEERACESACGGTQQCRGGVWRPCPQPIAEICGDTRDNDCDGQTDEQCSGCASGDRRECQTECGLGEEICAGDTWRFCTAPRVHPEVCGNADDEDCDGVVDEGCANCADGDERPCGNEFCPGVETCRDRTWGGCTAPTPADEACDAQDNDCDGEVDEEIARACDNACGQGWEICKDGTWSMCTAPENCPCSDGDQDDVQICGTCGTRYRSCGAGTWGEWSACDEGRSECQPGATEEGDCGNCGNRSRRCTTECIWGDWQPCSDEGVCIPGTADEMGGNAMCSNLGRVCSMTCEWSVDCSRAGPSACPEPGAEEVEACGNCGVRRRTCSDCCGWSEWSECVDQGECEPGSEDGRSCGGNCAVEVRVCNDQCQWGDYGECSAGGQCEPGAREEEACGNCGVRTRECVDGCVWGEWTGCASQGECNPGDDESRPCGQSVGECTPGEETRTCSDRCRWSNFGACEGEIGPAREICGNGSDEDCDGSDLEDPDQFDSVQRNDRCDQCTYLNNVRADGTLQPDVNTSIRATLDRAGDADHYCVVVNDGFNLPFTSEEFTVEVTDIPAGRDYDLKLFLSIEDCRDDNDIAASLGGGNRDERINWEERNGSDDGVFVIKVYSLFNDQSCEDSYNLSVDGLN